MPLKFRYNSARFVVTCQVDKIRLWACSMLTINLCLLLNLPDKCMASERSFRKINGDMMDFYVVL